ncbi:hypothetical protein [Xanthobacter flavus]|uniref:hypothetical protein n=1 Tax=Xanthobacter flavus TaxID=281 RepID=UPI00372A0ACF
MSAFLTALGEAGTREDLLAQIARLTEDRTNTAAAHATRVAELLEANNREVEKRRIAERALNASSFQRRVGHWMQACFGPAISADKLERGDRLLEEVLELLQSGGYPPERVAALTGYVWSRPAGEPAQEVGGVEVTLAAYCLAHEIDMHLAGETELARIWTKVAAIRAKQAAKPTGSALPMAWPYPAPAQEPVAGPPRSHAEEIEDLAKWLHDEGGFDEAASGGTWPENPDDDGRREGGYVKLVPSYLQAKFRDVARRLLRGRTLAHTAAPQQSSKLTWSGGESMTQATPSGAGYVIELFNDGIYGLRRHGEGISLHATEAAAKAAAQADYERLSLSALGPSPTHRHVKRGSEYRVIGEAEAQVSTGDYRPDWTIERRIADGDRLTVYQGADGKLWARFSDEFNDGRFVAIEAEA